MSTIKVDTIQTRAGAVPKASDLGLNVTGNVLQVVSTTKTDAFSTASGTFVDITGLSATITPTSTSSKVLIKIDFTISSSDVSGLNTFNLVRDSTNIAQPSGSATFQGSFLGYLQNSDNILPMSYSFLDSPSSTSATTYKIQMKTNSGTQYINRRLSTDCASTSTITVMEIGG